MYRQDIEVPDKYMGLIIGSQGKTLKYIGDVYNVHIKIKGGGFKIRGNILNDVNLSNQSYKINVYEKSKKRTSVCYLFRTTGSK